MGFSTNILVRNPVHGSTVYMENFPLEEGTGGDADANVALYNTWRDYIAARGSGFLNFPAGEFPITTFGLNTRVGVTGAGANKGNSTAGDNTHGTRFIAVDPVPMVLFNTSSQRGVYSQYSDVEFHGRNIATNIVQLDNATLYIAWQRVTCHGAMLRANPAYDADENGVVFKAKGLEVMTLRDCFLWGGEVIYKNEFYSGAMPGGAGVAAANAVRFEGGNIGEAGNDAGGVHGTNLIDHSGGALLILSGVNLEPFKCDDAVIKIADVPSGSGYARGIHILNCWGEIGRAGNTAFLEASSGGNQIQFSEFAAMNMNHAIRLTGGAECTVISTKFNGLASTGAVVGDGCVLNRINSPMTVTTSGSGVDNEWP